MYTISSVFCGTLHGLKARALECVGTLSLSLSRFGGRILDCVFNSSRPRYTFGGAGAVHDEPRLPGGRRDQGLGDRVQRQWARTIMRKVVFCDESDAKGKRTIAGLRGRARANAGQPQARLLRVFLKSGAHFLRFFFSTFFLKLNLCHFFKSFFSSLFQFEEKTVQNAGCAGFRAPKRARRNWT